MLRKVVAVLNRRTFVAGKNSWQGLKDAFINEEAFKVQSLLCLILIPLALMIAENYLQLLLLLCSLFLVLIVELLNTSIEIVVDRIGTEFNKLSGRAKDIGSAAVCLSMLLFFLVWITVITKNLGVLNY
ncbi:MAG: diacylglycerol kinase [Porticoccaceae bacterium]|jgi:diacylglycerol kinase (ATP)